MMKRKIASTVGVLMILVASLSGCAGTSNTKVTEANAEQVLNDAMTKTTNLSDQNVNLNMFMEGSYEDESVSVNMDMDAQLKNTKNIDLLEGKIDLTIGVDATNTSNPSNESMQIAAYLKDDNVYLSMDGQNAMIPLNGQLSSLLSSQESLLSNMSSSAEILSASSDFIKEITFTQTDNTIVFTTAFDNELLSEYINEIVDEAMNSMYDSTMASMQLTISGLEAVYTVENGYVTKVSLKGNMSITQIGETISTNFTADVNYVDPGKTLEIEYPDFSSYPSINA